MTLRSLLRRTAAIVAVFAAVLSVASAQSQVQMELGIGGNVVVGAWNPLRVVARDLPVGSRLEVTFDHGSLREGQVPFVLSLPVSGGPGLSVVERTVYVAPFHSVSWAVVGQGAIVASGSIPGRDQDETPLDVVLSRRSGVFAAALPNDARVVDVGAAQLPLDVAAYDGVRSVIVVRRGENPIDMESGRDEWYHDLMREASDDCPAVPVDAEHLVTHVDERVRERRPEPTEADHEDLTLVLDATRRQAAQHRVDESFGHVAPLARYRLSR